MKRYTTEVEAMVKGELLTFTGPRVPGNSFEDAQTYCENNGLGYCKVTGIFMGDIPYEDVGKKPIKKKSNSKHLI